MTLFHAPSVQAPVAYDSTNIVGTAAKRTSIRTRMQDSGFRYKITPQETAAGLVDANLTFGFDPGDFRRYGADPTGITASHVAIQRAINSNARVFDTTEGGSLYTLGAEILPPATSLRISGTAQPYGNTVGTVFKLLAVAGAGKAAFHWASSAYGVHAEHFAITFENGTLSQVGLQFDLELRSSVFRQVRLSTADQTAANSTIAIWLKGGGTFSGLNSFEGCSLSNFLFGFFLAGSITSTHIDRCEIEGQTAALGCIGVNMGALVSGVDITNCTIEGWNTAGAFGINSQGTYIRQVGNRYESNTVNFNWTRGGGNAYIGNTSLGEKFISGGVPTYPLNAVDRCVVLSSVNFDVDGAVINGVLGFTERGRAQGVGVFYDPAFNAGNFTGFGGGTWTVAGANNSCYKATLVGKLCTLIFNVRGSTSAGGNTKLLMAIPIPGATIKETHAAAVAIQNNNVDSIGFAQMVNGASAVEFYVDATLGGTAWTNSANTGMRGMVQFEIN